MSAEPEELDLGRHQAARQRILIPPCGGSNPPAPGCYFPVREKSATFPRVRLARPSLWSVIFGISVRAGRISGAGLCVRFSNFHFGGAETGSTVDRDRFAECSSGATPT